MTKGNFLKQKISFRSARLGDETFIKQLTRNVMREHVEATWPDEKDREHYYSINDMCKERTLIIEHQGEPIGRITFWHREHDVYVDNLHVVSVYQGQGVGTAAMKYVLSEAFDNNLPVILSVLQKNPARHLYQRLGFKVIDEKNFRYIMRYELPLAPEHG